MIPQKALETAAKIGDLEGIRKAIAAGANPKAFKSLALRWAVECGRVECVRELIPVSDVKAAREWMSGEIWLDTVALLNAIVEEEALKAKHHGRSPVREVSGL